VTQSASAMDAGRTLAGLRGGRLPVFCSDDERPVGRVDGWLASPEQGRQLLVRSGWWAPVIRRVAVSDIASADSRGVLLRLERERLLKQPPYVPDDELGLAAYEALWTVVPLRYAARFIQIQVRDGVVRLSGHVANEVRRRLTVQRVNATPGMLRVEDALVTDEQLVKATALAMLPHRELQPSRVRISADVGRVILEGELESPRDIELAIAVAASVPGVASVESRLRARPRLGAHGPAPPSREPKLVMIVPESCPPWRYVG
jgi:BON domain